MKRLRMIGIWTALILAAIVTVPLFLIVHVASLISGLFDLVALTAHTVRSPILKYLVWPLSVEYWALAKKDRE